LTGGAARAVALSPDGAHLYVSAAQGVALYARQAGSGALTFVGLQPMTDGIAGLSVAADGASAYGFDFGRNLVAVFRRDPSSGALALIEQQR